MGLTEQFREGMARRDDDGTAARGETTAPEHRGDRATAGAADPPRRRFASTPAATAGDVRAVQREEYGGINWGSAFFGWLVAIGIAALLTALLSAAGTALAVSEDAGAETIGVGGAIGLLVAIAIAYFAGGYVAGRMSRFDGGRQGFAVWLWALLVAVVLAAAGAILGSEYNLFEGLNMPRIPVDEGTLTTGGIVTLVVLALVPLVAAIAGGKVGERYHRRVDAVGFERAADRSPATGRGDEPAPATRR